MLDVGHVDVVGREREGLGLVQELRGEPLHVALLSIDGRRVFARLDAAPSEDAAPEEILAGTRVNLLVKDDGDQYFRIPQSQGFDIGNLVQSIRRRVGA